MSRFYKALETKYIAQIEESLAVLDLYFTNAVGVGEHPDILSILDENLSKIDDARGKLEILKQLNVNPENKDTNEENQRTNS